jgi:hypothetical protein
MLYLDGCILIYDYSTLNIQHSVKTHKYLTIKVYIEEIR